MKYLLALLISNNALACYSMKRNPVYPNLENQVLCKAVSNKQYDYSFGKGLTGNIDGVTARFKLIDTFFLQLDVSNSHISGDFRDLQGKGDFSEGTFIAPDFRYADLQRFGFKNIKIEDGLFLGANFSGVDLSTVEFMNCDLVGAIIDIKTKLPFSREEALEKGMVSK